MTSRIVQSLILPRDWWNFVAYQAWDSLRRQYARTKFGPWWVVATQFVMIGGIALVFSAVFNQILTDYLPFISASIITWNLISPTITQSPTVFVSGYSIIQSFRVPFAIFPIQLILNNYFVFLHGVIVHVWVLALMGKPLWLLPLGLAMSVVVVMIVYPTVALIGILGARFRDLGPAIGSVMFMMFLFTPVIWERRALTEDRRWLVDFNPFAHMIEIVRAPFIGNMPATESVIVCMVLAVAATLAGELVFRRTSRQLPFWV